MKNRIHLLCIVSIFVTIGLSACDFGGLCGSDQCEEGKMWCDDDNVIICERNESDNICNAFPDKVETCDSGKCVEFKWPGKQQEAGCLVPDKRCPEEGVEHVCDGTKRITCTPNRSVVRSFDDFDCVLWTEGNGYWDENDPIVGMEPTCVGGADISKVPCAFSNESCTSGDSKCVLTESGKSVPLRCDYGHWKFGCDYVPSSKDFSWTCAYSTQLKFFTCAYSTDECKNSETRCFTSPINGKKALQTCEYNLWINSLACSDCITNTDGTNTCVD